MGNKITKYYRCSDNKEFEKYEDALNHQEIVDLIKVIELEEDRNAFDVNFNQFTNEEILEFLVRNRGTIERLFKKLK